MSRTRSRLQHSAHSSRLADPVPARAPPPPTPPARKPPVNATDVYCPDTWPSSANANDSTYFSVRFEFEKRGTARCKVR